MNFERLINTSPTALIWLLIPDKERKAYFNTEVNDRQKWSRLGNEAHGRIENELRRFVGYTMDLDGEGGGSSFNFDIRTGSLIETEKPVEKYFYNPHIGANKTIGLEMVRIGAELDAVIDNHVVEIKPGGSGILGRYALQLAMNCLVADSPEDAYIYLYKKGTMFCLENGGSSIWGICEELIISGAIINYCYEKIQSLLETKTGLKNQFKMGDSDEILRDLKRDMFFWGDASAEAGKYFHTAMKPINWSTSTREGRTLIVPTAT